MSATTASQSAPRPPRTLSTGVVEMIRPLKYTDGRAIEYFTLKQFRKQFTKAEYQTEIRKLNRRQKISNTAQEKAIERANVC